MAPTVQRAAGMKRMLASLVVTLSVLPAAVADPVPIAVGNGVLVGEKAGDQEEWRGIRYAEAPVGALRWKPPVPTAPFGVTDATTFKDMCPQDWGEGVFGAEDCLFLNVFRPAGTEPPAGGWPVVVHLHGGGNVFGQGMHGVEVAPFVGRDVIVVTLNYRLSALGFMAHPRLTAEASGASGNYAYMDQIAALRWVRAHIASFGGDPTNVTLAGLSAGANDAQILMVSPLAQGLFARAALQTTGYLATYGGGGDLGAGEDRGMVVSHRIGCAGAADELACLRAAPVSALLAASWDQLAEAVIDGRVVTGRAYDVMRQTGGTMPLLIGSNRLEEAWFKNVLIEEGGFTAETYPFEVYVRESTNTFGTLASKVRRMYAREPNHMAALIAARSDSMANCPAREIARANGRTTYRYLYSATLDDPYFAQFASAHALEDILLWGGYGWYEMTAREAAIADRMQAYWTNFAKTGDPNGPGLPPWPVYTAADERMLDLDDAMAVLSGGYRNGECDLLEDEPLDAICSSFCRQFLASFRRQGPR